MRNIIHRENSAPAGSARRPEPVPVEPLATMAPVNQTAIAPANAPRPAPVADRLNAASQVQRGQYPGTGAVGHRKSLLQSMPIESAVEKIGAPIRGILTNFGDARYQFRESENMNYFATIDTAKGERTLWCVALCFALRNADACCGDTITVQQVKGPELRPGLLDLMETAKDKRHIETLAVRWKVSNELILRRPQQTIEQQLASVVAEKVLIAAEKHMEDAPRNRTIPQVIEATDKGQLTTPLPECSRPPVKLRQCRG